MEVYLGVSKACEWVRRAEMCRAELLECYKEIEIGIIIRSYACLIFKFF